MNNYPIYLALIRASDKYYVLAEKQGVISAFTTLDNGLKYFENSYNRAHDRGYESSMSACMNFMAYSPSIVMIESEEKFLSLFDNQKTAQFVHMSYIAGHMDCAIINQEIGESLFNSGRVPSLITPKQ